MIEKPVKIEETITEAEPGSAPEGTEWIDMKYDRIPRISANDLVMASLAWIRDQIDFNQRAAKKYATSDPAAAAIAKENLKVLEPESEPEPKPKPTRRAAKR